MSAVDTLYTATVAEIRTEIARVKGTAITLRVVRPAGWIYDPRKDPTLLLAGVDVPIWGASQKYLVAHFTPELLMAAEQDTGITSPDLKAMVFPK